MYEAIDRNTYLQFLSCRVDFNEDIWLYKNTKLCGKPFTVIVVKKKEKPMKENEKV